MTVLTAIVNELFGLSHTTPAETKTWLSDGGWQRLDQWIRDHPDKPSRGLTPTKELDRLHRATGPTVNTRR